jgi:ribosomal protein S18 acetylase RimI-like enzyme
MTAAQRLYVDLGFQEIAPYYENPIAGARYLELQLEPGPGAAAPIENEPLRGR